MAVVDIETLPKTGPERDREVCRVLEEGNILLFPKTPFELPEKDREFLRQRQTEAGYHKNIAYRPGGDRVTESPGSAEDARELRRVLRDYSRTAVDFASRLLAPYADSGISTTRASGPRKRPGASSRVTRATTCCTWIPSPPGPPAETGSSASSPTSIPRPLESGAPARFSRSSRSASPSPRDFFRVSAAVESGVGFRRCSGPPVFRFAPGPLTTSSCTVSTIS
jgi:hypothetical protein